MDLKAYVRVLYPLLRSLPSPIAALPKSFPKYPGMAQFGASCKVVVKRDCLAPISVQTVESTCCPWIRHHGRMLCLLPCPHQRMLGFCQGCLTCWKDGWLFMCERQNLYGPISPSPAEQLPVWRQPEEGAHGDRLLRKAAVWLINHSPIAMGSNWSSSTMSHVIMLLLNYISTVKSNVSTKVFIL